MTDLSSAERELQTLFVHMFSREVIESDAFMQSCFTPAMTIPLHVILESPRVLQITTDQSLIRRALDTSNCVSILDDQIRPNYKIEQNTIILRDLGSNTTEESLKTFFAQHDCPEIISCKSEMNETWFISFNTESDARTSLLKIRSEKLDGQPVRARLKTESMAKSLYWSRPGGVPSQINTSDQNQAQGMKSESSPGSSPSSHRRSEILQQQRQLQQQQQQGYGGGGRQVMYMQQHPQYQHQHQQHPQHHHHQQQQPVHAMSGPGGLVYYAMGPDGMMWPMAQQQGHYSHGAPQQHMASPLSAAPERISPKQGGGKKGKGHTNMNTNIAATGGMGKHIPPTEDKGKSIMPGKSNEALSSKNKQGESSSPPPAGQEKTEKKSTKKSKKKDKTDTVTQAAVGNGGGQSDGRAKSSGGGGGGGGSSHTTESPTPGSSRNATGSELPTTTGSGEGRGGSKGVAAGGGKVGAGGGGGRGAVAGGGGGRGAVAGGGGGRGAVAGGNGGRGAVAGGGGGGKGKGGAMKQESSKASQEFNMEADFPTLLNVPSPKSQNDVKDSNGDAPRVSWAKAISVPKTTKTPEQSSDEKATTITPAASASTSADVSDDKPCVEPINLVSENTSVPVPPPSQQQPPSELQDSATGGNTAVISVGVVDETKRPSLVQEDTDTAQSQPPVSRKGDVNPASASASASVRTDEHMSPNSSAPETEAASSTVSTAAAEQLIQEVDSSAETCGVKPSFLDIVRKGHQAASSRK